MPQHRTITLSLALMIFNGPAVAGPCDPSTLLAPATTRFLGSSANPSRVVAADLNLDGNNDLVVAERFANRVSVHLGNGDGTFAPGMPFSSGNQPVGLFIADFNGDTNLDIATGNLNDSSVSILLGDGLGGFSSGGDFDAGFFVTPDDIAGADFDADGDIDLVTSSQGNSVRVLLNNGDATFAPPVFTFISSSISSVDVGLINNDTIPDIVATGQSNNEVFVLIGTGNGTFGPPIGYPSNNSPRDVQIADINYDGHNDLVVAFLIDDQIGVYLGDSTGAFSPHITSALSDGPLEVQPADMDGDGALDIVVATFGTSPQSIALATGNADGTFNPQHDIPSGNGPVSVAIADFNNDGAPDVASVHTASNDLYIYLNTCPPAPTGCNPADIAAPLGVLDFFDVSAFLLAFNAQDPAADFNADGDINFFDVSLFLVAFNTGCP